MEKVAEIRAERFDDYICSIEFSPDGKSIAFGDSDGKIRLLDVAEREEIDVLDTQTGNVETIHFSSDGGMLGSVSLNMAELRLSVELWDMATHEVIMTFEFADNIAFSPDGALFAVRERGGVIRLYDMEQDEEGVINAGQFRRPLLFSPDSKLLMTGDRQGINLWDVENLEVVDSVAIDLDIWHTQFSPDGRFLVCADYNKVIIWDMIAQRKIETSDEHMERVKSVAISSDSRWLACAQHGAVKLWDLETHELLSIFKTTRLGRPPAGFMPYSIAISPDNHLLAAASQNHDLVMIWDIEDNEEFAAIDAKMAKHPYVYALAFSPDSELLAFGGPEGLQLWNMKTKREVLLDGNPGAVYSVTFSPDGEFLLSGGKKEIVHMWDLQKLRIVDRIEQPSAVSSLAYSPDGRQLAVGYANQVEIWDMQALRDVATFATDSPVYSVAFNNNGCLLAIRTMPGMILWDVAGREKVATFPVDDIYIYDAAFTPDGRFLACGVMGEVVLWDMEPYADICAGQSVEPDGKLEVLWGGIKSGSMEEQSDFVLGQNFPNPFNPDTWIPYRLSENGQTNIDIYDVSCQLIRRLSLGRKGAGVYADRENAAYWDGKNDKGERIASGVYFYTLHTDDSVSETRKMLLLK